MYTAVKCALILCAAFAATESTLTVDNALFHLFTRANPGVSMPLYATVESIIVSPISISRPTIFTIHNNGENAASNFNAFIINAALTNGDANVLALDWSPASSLYTIGLSNSEDAGKVVATFINILVNQFSYNPDLITIVGFGLGAHVAGIAGRNAVLPIGRIVALDPSLHGWTHNPNILSSDAATVVEVLHTTAGRQGYDRPLGHIDFYANGGVQQTGCGTSVVCSQDYAYVFFAESLTSEPNGPSFVGTACDDYKQAFSHQCSGDRGPVFGGTGHKSGISGVYYFNTNQSPPFAQN